MGNKRPSVLIIEHGASSLFTLKNLVESLRSQTEFSFTGQEGLSKALTNKHSLYILATPLPDMCAFYFVEQLRRKNEKPILMIEEQPCEENEIKAYDSGVNIYHSKPIAFSILEAQIKSLINSYTKPHIIKSLNICLDINKRMVLVNSQEVELTKTEMNLVILLFNSNGKIFTREQIISNIMNCHRNPSRFCVDTLVSRVRKKLDQEGSESFIKTMNGVGYCINSVYIKNLSREFTQ